MRQINYDQNEKIHAINRVGLGHSVYHKPDIIIVRPKDADKNALSHLFFHTPLQ